MTLTNPHERIYLSPPHMTDAARTLLIEAFDANWVAPAGPHLQQFEDAFAAKLGVAHAVALSSGTAALHLALLTQGVGAGDDVLCSTLTFTATANAIHYCGATPVFIDSELRSWNLDPSLVEDELRDRSRSGRRMPAAVVAVDVFGQCADYGALAPLCERYGVVLVVDAAESLGATCKNRPAGTHGVVGCFSFNGNKIVTAGGGGMLATDEASIAFRARHLATQAKEPAPHYEHAEIGFNYRMSNLLAAVGCGQLPALEERIAARRANFDFYRRELEGLPGVTFMPEADWGRSTRWLTCLQVDEQIAGANCGQLRVALDSVNIESRPIWKPMHLQPVHAGVPRRKGEVAERLFRQGLCLPSGSSLTDVQRQRVVEAVRQRLQRRRIAA